ncbi:hypothetical protein [Streptomyces sp. NPDC051554]|uniref:hypothetical protein n=1 Tax=Streptomyces sp. NPDC051554 TaxID=3365656 RepID=UPI0037B6088B
MPPTSSPRGLGRAARRLLTALGILAAVGAFTVPAPAAAHADPSLTVTGATIPVAPHPPARDDLTVTGTYQCAGGGSGTLTVAVEKAWGGAGSPVVTGSASLAATCDDAPHDYSVTMAPGGTSGPEFWIPGSGTVNATLSDASGAQAAALTSAPVTITVAPVPPVPDEPASCLRENKPDGGQTITCDGIPAHRYLTGTDGSDTININGSVFGSVDGGTGSDTITITFPSGLVSNVCGVSAGGRVTASGTSSVTATGSRGAPGGCGNAGTITAGTVTVNGGSGYVDNGGAGTGSATGGVGNTGTIILTGDTAEARATGGSGVGIGGAGDGNTGLIKGGDGTNTITAERGSGNGSSYASVGNRGTIDGNSPPAIKSTCIADNATGGHPNLGIGTVKNCTTGNTP